MLPCQQCRWRNDGDLKASHRGGKRSAHRNFGFAETHISADQAVHWLAIGQILKHLFDDAQLVVSFFIGEAVNKACISWSIDLNH